MRSPFDSLGRYRPRLTWAVVMLLALAYAPDEPHAQSPSPPDAARAVAALERAAGPDLAIRRSANAGVGTFLRMRGAAVVDTGESAAAPAEARARGFLARHGRAVGVRAPSELVTTRVSPVDAVGLERVRFSQTIGGIPVRGAELSIHLRGSGVVAVHGRTLDEALSLDLSPRIDASEAHGVAAASLAGDHPDVAFELSAPVLEVFNSGLFDGVAAPSHLAWSIEASASALRIAMWIDAHSGALLLAHNSLPQARNRFIHDAMSMDTVPGTLVRVEGQPPSGDVEIDNSYDYAGDTYDYFFGVHGRDSWDDAGAPMRSSVRYCSDPICENACPCPNAFWFGTQAVFGLLQGDDIVGHEFTHGVIESTADLIYLDESGALNESFADIFGETIDLGNGAGLDTPAVRWLIEEDLIPTSGIRNMADPNMSFLTPDPGKMTDPALACGPEDSGGVHTNSGIGNHAYVLMVDGGAYNGWVIGGIGLDKAAKIEYRALTTYLLQTSGYQDLLDALDLACTDLVGTSGISLADCVAVVNAATAVEMHLPWQCNCGNSSLDQGEDCDDGNNVSGDGCSAVCLFETTEVPIAEWPAWVLLSALLMVLGVAHLRSARSPSGALPRPSGE